MGAFDQNSFVAAWKRLISDHFQQNTDQSGEFQLRLRAIIGVMEKHRISVTLPNKPDVPVSKIPWKYTLLISSAEWRDLTVGEDSVQTNEEMLTTFLMAYAQNRGYKTSAAIEVQITEQADLAENEYLVKTRMDPPPSSAAQPSVDVVAGPAVAPGAQPRKTTVLGGMPKEETDRVESLPRAFIFPVDGSALASVVDIESFPVRIGRIDNANIPEVGINDPDCVVSARHAIIDLEGTSMVLRPDNPTNSLSVVRNGQETVLTRNGSIRVLDSWTLMDGDEIVLAGRVRLRFKTRRTKVLPEA